MSRIVHKSALLALVTAAGITAGLGALTACSVDQVTFSRPGATPDATPDAMPDSRPVLREICGTVGDEDSNGMADCLDPACVAGTATCTANASCFADCSVSRCGDNRINPFAGEEKDPPSSTSTTVPMSTATCRYDFSAMTQLYCTGTCGNWGGGNDCQQEDADAFCKLKTGNAAATARTFQLSNATNTPGICCPGASPGCKVLGELPVRGVMVVVSIHDTDLRSTHGGGQTIVNVDCAVP